MREVVLSIPNIEPEQNVEIEVRINGRKKTLNYRVELVTLEDYTESSTGDTVTVLKHVIHEYDKNWELVQIGAPTHDKIPIMFRKRECDKE
jgi:hypothetical protein